MVRILNNSSTNYAMSYKFTIGLLIISLLPSFSKGQDTITISEVNVLYGIITDDDTLLISQIEPVLIFPRPKFNSRREWRRYDRLVRNVKRVYPYAKLAGAEYDTIANHMLSLKTDKERRQYIKQIESEIMILNISTASDRMPNLSTKVNAFFKIMSSWNILNLDSRVNYLYLHFFHCSIEN